MEPPARGIFTIAEYDGKSICALEIPGIDVSLRPCYYKGAGIHGGSYIRVGEADKKMTDYEIYSFEAFRKQIHDDERPVNRASLELLNSKKLEKYEFVVTFYNEVQGFTVSGSSAKDYDLGGKDLLAFCTVPRSRREIAEYLGLNTIFYVMEKYVQPLVDKGILKLTIPDKPKSKNQRYYW